MPAVPCTSSVESPLIAAGWDVRYLPTAVFEVPPATLRILSNATVSPITEVQRAADAAAASTGA